MIDVYCEMLMQELHASPMTYGDIRKFLGDDGDLAIEVIDRLRYAARIERITDTLRERPLTYFLASEIQR